MTQDRRRICPFCAWRVNCAKRFSMGDDGSLHCPDFSEDITLRPKAETGQKPQDSNSDEGKTS